MKGEGVGRRQKPRAGEGIHRRQGVWRLVREFMQVVDCGDRPEGWPGGRKSTENPLQGSAIVVHPLLELTLNVAAVLSSYLVAAS